MGALTDADFWKQYAQGINDAFVRGGASALGGGVDLATAALRPLGYSTPSDQVVGSSDWLSKKMEGAGVVSTARNPTAEFLTSILMPLAASRQGAASIAGAINKAGENLSAPSTMANASQRGAIVWHGSPHTFDKFDSSKIGAGEGAQSYGHGLYLADSPAVAKSYQEQLAPGSGAGPADIAARWLKSSGGDADAARAGLRNVMQRAMDAGEDVTTLRAAYGALFEPEKISGALYKVDMPDSAISRMLDWDAGGAKVWADAVKQHGGEKQAAAALQAQGIPGIRYLDALSRDAEKGTSNYVVFPGNEDMLQILERNGYPVSWANKK